jgi:hypothetical protein
MIRIAITAEAFEAIARTLALGAVSCEPQPNENGERLIRVEERWLVKRRVLATGTRRVQRPTRLSHEIQ